MRHAVDLIKVYFKSQGVTITAGKFEFPEEKELLKCGKNGVPDVFKSK
jgi:hypothetical protein